LGNTGEKEEGKNVIELVDGCRRQRSFSDNSNNHQRKKDENGRDSMLTKVRKREPNRFCVICTWIN